ncbi:modular serine protease-like [Drosophila guanche]|uniref:Blast:Low-density lipoprotein receptor-related protein 2 n=1 Tax=Drosophila guanche TaxID=7266 RepID=A0A3B0JSX6_DROGU|nr:modular serine protease-like [Drosophila guanche]SPP84123.1 blast:Low-density lipoprotein receptor-related protein 2 [Drosophila guanche]
MTLVNVLAFIFLLGLTLGFQCITKTKVPLRETQICNGIVDCVDKSDEMFELCYNRTCNEEHFFRCTYGGCLEVMRKCDNTIDCWDSSDENKLICEEDTDMWYQLYDDLQGDCDDQFNCEEMCLEWSQVCDGQIDCKDGRDENITLCATIDCPYPAFRCLYGGCISAAALCNHIPDCFDGSDELPGICLHTMGQHPPLVADGPLATSQVWEVRHCRLEDPSGALIAENYVGSTTYRSNATVRDQAVVTLSCGHGHGLIGEQKNICDGDNWRYELAKCVPQCQHTGTFLYKGQCTHQGRLIDCDQALLPMDTRMVVTCASGYEAHEKPGVQVCHGNGNWVVEEELPKCEPICGVWKLKDQEHEQSSDPWMVSIFQRSREPFYEYRCVATILSHYVLVTSEQCFRNKPIKGAPSTEPVLYAVAEGQVYGNSFWANEEHSYKLHNVSYIHNVTRSDGKAVGALALVHLIQPLEFNVRVRPICLTNDMPRKWQTNGDFFDVPVGKPIVQLDNSNRYELAQIYASQTDKYHISAFIEPIRKDIAKCQESGNI